MKHWKNTAVVVTDCVLTMSARGLPGQESAVRLPSYLSSVKDPPGAGERLLVVGSHTVSRLVSNHSAQNKIEKLYIASLQKSESKFENSTR